jgi:hypothetical protein
MGQKVYYDSVNNKEVVDVSGAKDEAALKAEFGLDVSTQTIELTDDDAYHYINNGTLTKKTKVDHDNETAAAQAARETARAAKETAIKAKLGLTDQDFDDLKEALG